jgi:hypothetical protein
VLIGQTENLLHSSEEHVPGCHHRPLKIVYSSRRDARPPAYDHAT